MAFNSARVKPGGRCKQTPARRARLAAAANNLQIMTMKWIHWDKVLATGHLILDTDHEHLVDLFNQLATSVKERQGKIACAELLETIIQYAKRHFAFEEQLMADEHYPKIDYHAAEHFRLIKQAIRYKAKFEAGEPESHISLIHFPEDWLTFHILTADKELATFLSAAAEQPG